MPKFLKINKEKLITEAVKLHEDSDLNPLDDHSEAVKDVIEGGKEANKDISVDAAKNVVNQANQTIEKFNLHPYASTAVLSEVEQKLQACLEAAYTDKQNGIDADYPDMLIYGLAGFGKTAGVKAFCRDHGIYMLSLDAKTLRPEQLSGLPKAVKDDTGNEVQGNLALPLWTELDKHEAVVLVVDEVNRAKPNVVGTLLGLICDHELPIYHTDKNGNYQSVKKFPNILFTVAMINPASRDLFTDVTELDPALVNRFGIQHEAVPDNYEFLRVLSKIYSAILDVKSLHPDDRDRYQGQLDIATWLLKQKGFKFDDRDKAVDAHKAQRDRLNPRPRDTLSYRSFLKLLRMCDGTKADFLQKLKWHGFLDDTADMISTLLQPYTDTIKKNGFTKRSEAEQKAAAGIASALGAFGDNL